MRQTWAVMVDAYRELNAKKLFWVSMVISALVVVAFAAVSLTPRGIKVLAWEFPFALNLSLLSNATFYKYLFQSLGVKFWLTWAATILGLVATCAMIPDFTAGGAVELAIAKPIRRARLFLTKYLAGLLFMFLQVGVFSAAAVLLIGIRGREWVPSLLLAIPIVTLTYSYLFSVCALVGLVTRSTIFALIATLVVWMGIFAVHTLEAAVMLQLRVAAEMNVERTQRRLEKIDSGEKPEAQPKPKSLGDLVGGLVNAVKPGPPPATRASLEAKLAEYQDSLETWTRWHRILYVVKTVLPKTTETTDLLQRAMFAKGELEAFEDNQVDRAEKMRSDRMRMLGREQPTDRPVEMGDPLLAREVDRRLGQRSVAWVIGTSLAFEAAVLALACWLFSRRDF